MNSVSCNTATQGSSALQSSSSPTDENSKPLIIKKYDHDHDEDILATLFTREYTGMADPRYIGNQPELTGHYIHIVVDWMVEICIEYRLNNDVLFTACNILHRTLSICRVTKKAVQLIALTALFIASKVELSRAPSINRFSLVTNNLFTPKDIIKMEAKILNLLDWNICVPTQRSFQKLFLSIANVQIEDLFLVHYLTELSLRDTVFLKYRPSLIVISAITLAQTNGIAPNQALMKTSHYTKEEIFACCKDLVDQWTHCTNGRKGSSYVRYNRNLYNYASLRRPPVL